MVIVRTKGTRRTILATWQSPRRREDDEEEEL